MNFKSQRATIISEEKVPLFDLFPILFFNIFLNVRMPQKKAISFM